MWAVLQIEKKRATLLPSESQTPRMLGSTSSLELRFGEEMNETSNETKYESSPSGEGFYEKQDSH